MSVAQGQDASPARSLGRRLGRAFPFIAALILLLAVSGDSGAGRKSEGASRDLMTRFGAVVQGPRAGTVAVVVINDAEYDTLFAATGGRPQGPNDGAADARAGVGANYRTTDRRTAEAAAARSPTPYLAPTPPYRRTVI